MARIPVPLSVHFEKHKFLDSDGVWKVRSSDLIKEIEHERDENRKQFKRLFSWKP